MLCFRLVPLSIFIFLNAMATHKSHAPILPNNFYDGMQTQTTQFKHKYSKQENSTMLTALQELYQHNHPSKISKSPTAKIPKIIHHIWVGTKPIPENVEPMRQTWKKLHPGWTFKLWTNEEVKKLKWINPEAQSLYNRTKDPREKADLARYQILYEYGGVYSDADVKCVKSFSDLCHYYDFFVGISGNTNAEILNSAIIGATPANPIITTLLQNIKDTDALSFFQRAGVFYFSRGICENILTAPGVNIALPTDFFYALPFLYNLKGKPISSYTSPLSMVIHYWAHTSDKNWKKKR